ncbi:MAG: serine hydrolase [Gammaproteobacteria bacterium]|nr:serine hydrolase [Gammaproteobacteria bacterium]MBK81497.1 serine hydrolase [Gammaproteobacteria bacterium]|tara:strand:+ start:2741 stop:3952 length:1212 start_codon:yes stop_codon:yes gene_type:complete
MDTAPELAGFSAARLARIDEHLLQNFVEPQKIPGCQVLVARRGHVAHFSTLGLMDIERGRPMADDTIFRIYSMTKPITSIALMQLYERGLFQLNDPVHRVVPEWRDARVWVSGEGDAMETRAPDRPITFRDMLCHTAGLSYGATRHPVDKVYRDLQIRRGEGETLSSFVDKLTQVPLHYSPGERWMYSYATDVCGHLVEALSGMTLDRYFQSHVFEPLGMTDTAFHVDAGRVERFAANYQRRADKTLALIDDPMASSYAAPPAFLSGGGGLVATTADYLRFCDMLRCGGTLDGQRIIGSRTLRMMTRNHLAGGRDLTEMAIGAFSETAYEGTGFGLGFATTLSEVAAGQLGEGDYFWGGAASTIFWVDPREDLVVIFMTQLMPSATFNFRGQLKNIVYGAIED